MNTAPTLILGIGNILLKDEGIGVRVVEAMQDFALPEGVELVDGGTSGADLVELLADRRKVIVIDAIDAQHPPGTILRMTLEDILPAAGDSISLHQFGLADSLVMGRQMGVLADEVVIIGVQPNEISPGLELTPELAAMIPRVIEIVLGELEGGKSTEYGVQSTE